MDIFAIVPPSHGIARKSASFSGANINFGVWHAGLGPKGGLTLGKKSHLVAALVQAGALLINHIAPGNRTLAPSA